MSAGSGGDPTLCRHHIGVDHRGSWGRREGSDCRTHYAFVLTGTLLVVSVRALRNPQSASALRKYACDWCHTP